MRVGQPTPSVVRSINYFNEPAIIAAVRVLPQDISAVSMAFLVPPLFRQSNVAYQRHLKEGRSL